MTGEVMDKSKVARFYGSQCTLYIPLLQALKDLKGCLSYMPCVLIQWTMLKMLVMILVTFDIM